MFSSTEHVTALATRPTQYKIISITMPAYFTISFPTLEDITVPFKTRFPTLADQADSTLSFTTSFSTLQAAQCPTPPASKPWQTEQCPTPLIWYSYCCPAKSSCPQFSFTLTPNSLAAWSLTCQPTCWQSTTSAPRTLQTGHLTVGLGYLGRRRISLLELQMEIDKIGESNLLTGILEVPTLQTKCLKLSR